MVESVKINNACFMIKPLHPDAVKLTKHRQTAGRFLHHTWGGNNSNIMWTYLEKTAMRLWHMLAWEYSVA